MQICLAFFLSMQYIVDMKKYYIHRQIENTLKKIVKQFPAVAVTGPRQSGKSTLLKELFSKTHNYISLDDPLVREQVISDPRLFLDNAGEKVIIDEIQYAPQFLSYVKIKIDNERLKKGRFLFTGSQQFPLIKNLGDSLAGRIGLLDLLPFNVSEKRKITGMKTRLLDATGCFIHACLYGSYPEIVTGKNIDINAWYGAYFQTYLERDIRTIYNIGGLRDFQLFMQLLATRCSQILNMTSLSNDLGITVNTIKKWISLLEVSRIIYLLPQYYNNLGKRITKSPKVYFLDCGMVCYLTGLKHKEHLLKGPMAGALFENFCIQETVKYFFNRGIQPRIFYFHSHNELEVDLLIEAENMSVYPIEIKFSKTPKMSMANNIHRFKKLLAPLNIKEGRILSLSDENMVLTRDTSVQRLDKYFSWLETVVT